MHEIILFDLDGTLLNTEKWFTGVWHPRLRKALNIDQETLVKAEAVYRRQLSDIVFFDPDAYLLNLATYFGSDLEKLRTEFYLPVSFKESVYDDVVPCFTQLQAAGKRLGVFSQGHPEFQLRKLELMGLLPWFEQDLICLSYDKTAPEFIEQLPHPATIIDNTIDRLLPLSEDGQFELFWLDRVAGNNTASEYPNITCIRTLAELLSTPLQ